MQAETPMQPTRWEILQLLKRRGRATVDELSKALNMTLMGVRLHLVVVERDGYVRRSTLREKPGRPALIYSLTPKAEELFPKRYDLLAEKLLDALRSGDGSVDPDAILEAAGRSVAQPLKERLHGGSLEERVRGVTELLDENGAFTSCEKVEDGYLIYQHNCLFYSVALRNPEVCAMDVLFLRELLGLEPERRECIVDGAGRCVYFVRG